LTGETVYLSGRGAVAVQVFSIKDDKLVNPENVLING
jgi:hypothetical protein